MAKNEKSEAAEKIEKAAKAKKAGAPKAKKENVFKRIGKWFAKFGKDFKGEIKKITWPGPKMVLKSTLVVIVSIVIIGLAVFVVDWCLSRGVDGLESLATKHSQSANEEDADADDSAESGDDAALAAEDAEAQAAEDTTDAQAAEGTTEAQAADKDAGEEKSEAAAEAATTEAATTEAAKTEAAQENAQ